MIIFIFPKSGGGSRVYTFVAGINWWKVVRHTVETWLEKIDSGWLYKGLDPGNQLRQAKATFPGSAVEKNRIIIWGACDTLPDSIHYYWGREIFMGVFRSDLVDSMHHT